MLIAPRVVVAAVVFVLFTLVGLLLHHNFRTAAFDLGIFDQAFWRYSHFLSTFNTVRGLHILGDHFSVISLLFGPLYRIVPDVAWPIAFQALSVAVGGMFLYSIAKNRLDPALTPWIPFGFMLSYYLHPAVHSTLLWQYHAMVLASGLYLGLIWSYTVKKNLPLFVLIVLLLLACREDMPFTIAVFGLLATLERRWKYALWALGLSMAWWLFAVKLAMPYFNGEGYFRHENGTLSLLFANSGNPKFYLDRLSDPRALRYAWQVIFPMGFLALLAPRYLLPGLPTLLVNMLIGDYNIKIGYHYCVNTMPFLFWAAVEGLRSPLLAKRIRSSTAYFWLTGLLVLSTVLSYAQYSSLNVRYLPAMIRDFQANGPKRAFLANLEQTIGPQGGVAASDFLLPHLSHRKNIYLFPNPWKIHYWGIRGENPHHPNEVDYIVIEETELSAQGDLLGYLINGALFQKIDEQYGTLVFKRIKAEDPERREAIARFERYSLTAGLKFSGISASPEFSTSEADFRRLDCDPVALNESVPPAWTPLANPQRGAHILDVNFCAIGDCGPSKTRYIRAVVFAGHSTRAKLDIGSDDGVTVWLNGRPIHENIVWRSAHLGDDSVDISLTSGQNVFVFRVNSIGGAWRLLARVIPPPKES